MFDFGFRNSVEYRSFELGKDEICRPSVVVEEFCTSFRCHDGNVEGSSGHDKLLIFGDFSDDADALSVCVLIVCYRFIVEQIVMLEHCLLCGSGS